MTNVAEIYSAAALRDVLDTNDFIVVDFAKRNGCVPCRRLKPHFEAAAGSEELKHVKFVVVYLDELETHDDFITLVDGYKLMSTPTVIFFDSGGPVIPVIGRTAPVLIKEIEGLSNV